MRFLAAAHTDAGLVKKVNQDAFCLKTARTSDTNIAFAVMCDGMGGLNNGELASAFTVNAFSDWFENKFSSYAQKNTDFNRVTSEWREIVLEQGKKILEYGSMKGFSLGTTLTAFLAVENNYAVIHVGDSRLYHISDSLEQITRDQTAAALAVEQGRMTPEEAKNDRRSSILLQCVGASKNINPEIRTGVFQENDVFMLCSDGFRHKISDEELYEALSGAVLKNETVMNDTLVDLVELNKARAERDNITAILIKAIR